MGTLTYPFTQIMYFTIKGRSRVKSDEQYCTQPKERDYKRYNDGVSLALENISIRLSLFVNYWLSHHKLETNYLDHTLFKYTLLVRYSLWLWHAETIQNMCIVIFYRFH